MSRKGVLDESGCQVLAQMCFFVFVPTLTFAKITQAVSLDSIAHLWPLLLNLTLSVMLGLCLGLLLNRLLRTPIEFHTHALIACGFGNVGNFPLLVVTTLCHDKTAIFFRTLGADCEHLGIAYTAFDIAAATLWQFTIAINLIRRGKAAADEAAAALHGGSSSLKQLSREQPGAATRNEDLANQDLAQRGLRKMGTLSDLLRGGGGSGAGSGRGSPRDQELLLASHQQQQEQQYQQYQQYQQQQQQPASQHSMLVELQPSAHPVPVHLLAEQLHSRQHRDQHQQHQQYQHQQHQQHSKARQSPLASDDTAALLPVVTGGRGPSAVDEAGPAAGPASWRQRSWSRLPPALQTAGRYLGRVAWGQLFPLPSQAAILAIVCGCIPAVKALFFGPNPPLRMLSEACDALGAGLIPVATPMLGAVLYRAAGGGSRMPLRVTLGVLFTKLILHPALMTLLVVAALSLRLFTPPDALFLLTLLLSNATPTAINLQTLMVLYRHGEAEMSTLLYWQYLASALTVPAYMWLFQRIIVAWVL
ncbi:hypothetical protein D9Q98_003700 [Chlorella vulgaris]|uniref:Auxin efflux carrier n=1 Tax=Chlorella vulgaris TaxID=3077 RepID=A0A9D4TTP5_CHLVU|nr:hypothetical protein D9Q98_003700 [Chlorella vulgaris]